MAWVQDVLEGLVCDKPDDPWSYIDASTAAARKAPLHLATPCAKIPYVASKMVRTVSAPQMVRTEADLSWFRKVPSVLPASLRLDSPPADTSQAELLFMAWLDSLPALPVVQEGQSVQENHLRSPSKRCLTEKDLSWVRRVPSVLPASERQEEAPATPSEAELLFMEWLNSLPQVAAVDKKAAQELFNATQHKLCQTETDLSWFRRVPSVLPASERKEPEPSQAETLFMHWLRSLPQGPLPEALPQALPQALPEALPIT